MKPILVTVVAAILAVGHAAQAQDLGETVTLTKSSPMTGSSIKGTRNSGFAAGVVWETAPIFHAAVVNYQEEGFCRNSRRRVEKGASARPSLTVFRRKNLVDGRFQHSRFSN
jgi:hypothetical protein